MIIGARFNGPPGTGNGGYSAGLVASHVDAGDSAVEVTLRRPPPLETELTVRVDDDGQAVRVLAGEDLVLEARSTTVEREEVVSPVSWAEAVEASRAYSGFTAHPFPTCFVCGPERAAGDGLRIFPGRLGAARTAAPFVVPADVSPVLVWAALDCPGGWSVPLEARPYVLGRIAARVDAVPAPGDECVVVGEMIREEGRKAFVRSTVYGPDGRALATARATWLALSS
jgi:hypothetical protein